MVLAYLLPVLGALIYAAAGWTGMRLRRFLPLDLAGTSLWVVVVVGLGYTIGRPAKRGRASDHALGPPGKAHRRRRRTDAV